MSHRADMPIGRGEFASSRVVRCCSSGFWAAALVAQVRLRGDRAAQLIDFEAAPRAGRRDRARGSQVRRLPGWVFVAVGTAVLGVAHAIGAAIAAVTSPDFVTVGSLLFVAFWYWTAVGGWRRSSIGIRDIDPSLTVHEGD
jgi:hypothetical protein